MLEVVSTITTLRSAFHAFLVAKRVEGHRKKTLVWYDYIFSSAAKVLGADIPVTTLSTIRLRQYLVSLEERGLSRVSLADHLRGLRTFTRWCVAEGLILSDPSSGIQKIRIPRQFPKLVSEEDVERLLKVCDTATYEGNRNYAMLLLFVDCGLRRGEILSLTPSDVNLLVRSILVHHGKGDKSRMVFIGKRTAIAIRRWLEMRHHPVDFPLFCSRKGHHLNPRSLVTILERLAKKAGITAKVSPHRLRHTAATMMAKAGMNAFELAQLLGHSDVKTTMIYTHLGGMALREAHARASPADKLFK